jgi:hypothetical protein
MFKLKTKRWGEVEVSFMHINPARGGTNYISPGTECHFDNAKTKKEEFHLAGDLAYGKTILHQLDCHSYCKEFGRKLSLKRALEDLGATRQERTEFWQAYFEAKEMKQ